MYLSSLVVVVVVVVNMSFNSFCLITLKNFLILFQKRDAALVNAAIIGRCGISIRCTDVFSLF